MTVALAFAVFGEVLAPLQLLGGGLVLAGVLVLSGGGAARRVGRRRRLHGAVAGRPSRARHMPAKPAASAATNSDSGLSGRGSTSTASISGIAPGAALVTPGHVQVLAPDDLGQIRGQDEVGVRVIDGQMEVRHLS